MKKRFLAFCVILFFLFDSFFCVKTFAAFMDETENITQNGREQLKEESSVKNGIPKEEERVFNEQYVAAFDSSVVEIGVDENNQYEYEFIHKHRIITEDGQMYYELAPGEYYIPTGSYSTTFRSAVKKDGRTSDNAGFSFDSCFKAFTYIKKSGDWQAVGRGQIVQGKGEFLTRIVNIVKLKQVEPKYGKDGRTIVAFTAKIDPNKRSSIEKTIMYRTSFHYEIVTDTGESFIDKALSVLGGFFQTIIALVEPFIDIIARTISVCIVDIVLPIFVSIFSFYWRMWTKTVMVFVFILIHWLLIAFLRLVDLFEKLSNMLAGIDKVEYLTQGESPKHLYLLNIFLSYPPLRRFFLGVTVIGVVLAFVSTIYVVAKHTMVGSGKQPKTMGHILGSGAKSMLALLTLPFSLMTILNLSNFVLGRIVTITRAGGTNDVSLGSYIYASCVYFSRPDPSRHDYLDGSGYEPIRQYVSKEPPLGSIQEFIEKYGKIRPLYSNPRAIEYCNVAYLNYIVAFICVIFALYILISTTLSFVQKIFEILVLYIAAPLFAASIPLDDGQTFGKWRNMLIAKSAIGYSVLVSLNLFFLFIPKIVGDSVNFTPPDEDVVKNLFIKIAFMLGGLYAASQADAIIIQMIDWQAGGGASETMQLIGSQLSGLSKMGLNKVVGNNQFLNRLLTGSGGGGRPPGYRGPGGEGL